MAHISFYCDGDVAAHFFGCESRPYSEVSIVNFFATCGDDCMAHVCMIEFDELRCCVTLKNAAYQTLGTHSSSMMLVLYGKMLSPTSGI